jgi:hypothetical protein
MSRRFGMENPAKGTDTRHGSFPRQSSDEAWFFRPIIQMGHVKTNEFPVSQLKRRNGNSAETCTIAD